MLQLTYLFVGLLAVLASGVTLSQRIDKLTRTITAVFAMVAWAYWSVSSFAVEVAGGPTDTYVGLVAIGAVTAGIMLLSAVHLAFEAMGEEETRNEVLNPHE